MYDTGFIASRTAPALLIWRHCRSLAVPSYKIVYNALTLVDPEI